MAGTNECREPDYLENQHTFDHDIDGEKELGTAVTTAVASVTGSPMTDVGDSLTESVDLDGLDRIFRCSGNQPRAAGRLVLTVDGCFVTISSDGCITVEP